MEEMLHLLILVLLLQIGQILNRSCNTNSNQLERINNLLYIPFAPSASIDRPKPEPKPKPPKTFSIFGMAAAWEIYVDWVA